MSDTKLVIYTGTKWCSPCKILEKMLEKFQLLKGMVTVVDLPWDSSNLITNTGEKIRRVPSLWVDDNGKETLLVFGPWEIIAELRKIRYGDSAEDRSPDADTGEADSGE